MPEPSPSIDTAAWILRAEQPHTDALYIANGYMGAALDFTGGLFPSSRQTPCYVRGVYTVSGPHAIDRLAILPSWNHFRYGHAGTVQTYARDVDLRRGVVRTEVVMREDRGDVRIVSELFLSRDDQHEAVARLVVVPTFSGEVRILAGLDCPPGRDAVVRAVDAGDEVLALCTRVEPYGIEVAQSLQFEHSGAVVETGAGQTEVFATLRFDGLAGEELSATQFARIATSLETDDPATLATRRRGTYRDVYDAHVRAFENLWKTDIEIDGDLEAQQFARAALFYLWSSVKEDDSWSIAPMGLSGNFYNGHIFWDAELWMYPSLLVTHPAMGRSCVAYRERTLQAARDRAAANGHAGAQYPWEGGFTGVEMTPPWAETRDFQLHITADVAIGQWWYYLVTGDISWLVQHGFPIIRACAEYWVSRVEYNAKANKYEISDVVCADEYAEHVNNNAFTNAAVRRALLIACRAAELVEEIAPAEWSEVAAALHIPYDSEHGRHVEYDGYDGQPTKQADVELLAYPLEHATDRAQIERDLEYYGSVIDPHGPAMSFSVYSILLAQLGRAEEAYEFFRKSFVPNTTRPFWSFSETPTNNEYFFCTGAGGALQTLLFGFSGLRLREDHISIRPILPPKWTALRLRNLTVQGVKTDIEIEHRQTVVCRHRAGGDVRATIDLDTWSVTFQWRATLGQGHVIWVDGSDIAADTHVIRAGEAVTIPEELRNDFRVRLETDRNTVLIDLRVLTAGA